MKYLDAGATISKCGFYRYKLWRYWDKSKPMLAWVMLNPSTADGDADDPTILKCVGFAMKWGFGGIQVVNLYSFRATSPDDLVAAHYPVADDYAAHHRAIRDALLFSKMVVAAWGTKARGKEVDDLLERWPGAGYDCLGINKDGSPKHPLYISYETEAEKWEPRLW